MINLQCFSFEGPRLPSVVFTNEIKALNPQDLTRAQLIDTLGYYKVLSQSDQVFFDEYVKQLNDANAQLQFEMKRTRIIIGVSVTAGVIVGGCLLYKAMAR
jgi:hypothetical protein